MSQVLWDSYIFSKKEWPGGRARESTETGVSDFGRKEYFEVSRMSLATRGVRIIRQKYVFHTRNVENLTNGNRPIWIRSRFKGTKRASQQLPITPHGAPTARDGNNSSYWDGRIDLPSFDSKPAYRRAGFMPAGGRAQSQVHARNFRV